MKPYSDAERIKLQKNLSAIRKVAGWTTADLGELIGVTKQTISNLENSKTPMTKTQYIAIRSIIDCEIVSNPENETLARVVNILLDSEDLSEEEQVKVEAAVAYVNSAKKKGIDSATIVGGLSALVAALGLIIAPSSSASIAKTTAPLWIEAINKAKKK